MLPVSELDRVGRGLVPSIRSGHMLSALKPFLRLSTRHIYGTALQLGPHRRPRPTQDRWLAAVATSARSSSSQLTTPTLPLHATMATGGTVPTLAAPAAPAVDAASVGPAVTDYSPTGAAYGAAARAAAGGGSATGIPSVRCHVFGPRISNPLALASAPRPYVSRLCRPPPVRSRHWAHCLGSRASSCGRPRSFAD